MKFLFLFLCGLVSMGTVGAQSLKGLKQKGVEAYDKGEYGLAYDNFARAFGKRNESSVRYNLANTHYQLKEYKRAMELYAELIEEDIDDSLKAKVYHNLGNCYFQMDALKESFHAYKNALLLSPTDHDSKMNLSKVIRLLKQREKQNKEESGKGENNNKEEEKDSQKNQEDESGQDQKDQSDGTDQDQRGQDQKDQSDGTDQDPRSQDQKESSESNGGSEGVDTQLSKEQAELLLKIIEEEERKVLDKLKSVPNAGKKAEKEW